MRKINHFGIPTTTPQPGEVYVEGLKVWLTNFNEVPIRKNICVLKKVAGCLN